MISLRGSPSKKRPRARQTNCTAGGLALIAGDTEAALGVVSESDKHIRLGPAECPRPAAVNHDAIDSEP